MALNLDVDGKQTANPRDSDIAHAFESLEKGATRLLSGPGLSIIVLSRGKAEELAATGTHAMGFMLSYHQNGSKDEFSTDPQQPLSVGEVIRAFQLYARGEDWGQSLYKWKRVGSMKEIPIGNIILLIILGGITVAIIKFLASR